MKVLIACEFSGIVRNAFRARGHDAWSCDLVAAADNSPYHLHCDVRKVYDEWDLLIAHPPCTYLASSGARWFAQREKLQDEAVEFVRYLLRLPISRIAVENPIGVLSTRIRKPDQIIQPWQFGHGEVKATYLWLKNLPLLESTRIVFDRNPRIHNVPRYRGRGYERSITYPGIAEAMAEQWGKLNNSTTQETTGT